MKNTKEMWTARLPHWREYAVGRLRDNEVYLVVTLTKEQRRLISVEIPAEHARQLAVDLLKAAERADNGPIDPIPATTRIQQQLALDLGGGR